MRIKQLCVNCGEHFKRGLIAKYGLVKYTKTDEPVMFKGCYGEKQVERICSHEGLALLSWAGGDCSWAVARPHIVEKLKAHPNIKHLAISNFIEDDLKRVGIPYISLPILPYANEDLKAEPLGDSVYIYKMNLYNRPMNQRVKDRLPHINFIECDFHSYTKDEMSEVYKKCFIGIRLINHDGLSNTVCELGLMGRKVIWNGNTPNAIHYTINDLDDIVKKIEVEYANRHSDGYIKVAEEVRNYLDVGEEFLESDNYTT